MTYKRLKRFEFRNLWSNGDYSFTFIPIHFVYDKAQSIYEDTFIEFTFLNFEFRWFV